MSRPNLCCLSTKLKQKPDDFVSLSWICMSLCFPSSSLATDPIIPTNSWSRLLLLFLKHWWYCLTTVTPINILTSVSSALNDLVWDNESWSKANFSCILSLACLMFPLCSIVFQFLYLHFFCSVNWSPNYLRLALSNLIFLCILSWSIIGCYVMYVLHGKLHLFSV